MRTWALCVLTAGLACAADRSSAEPPGALGHTVISTADEVMSDPPEYAYRRPSAEAGREYFAVTGVGDPYGAGIPYPVLLGLQSMYPDRLGADWHEITVPTGLSS